MILTVGMIVKNEEKYLERCLTAIKPILEKVDSELIITDTGSSDGTVGTAKRFTDKILYFDWINDFSAARNTGIEKARGEWFMSLDADEIFRSCDEIVDFFVSGEYRHYNSASFIVRNITDENGDYSDTAVPRLTRLSKETRFVGAVHETLSTFGLPVKFLGSIADHYGYNFSDKESARKKAGYYYELLKGRYDKSNIYDPVIFLQLYDCCVLLEQKEEANMYLDEGIKYCSGKKLNTLSVLYCKKAYGHFLDKDYKEALNICEKYFAMDKAVRPGELTADKEVLAIKAVSLYFLGEYAAAEKTYARFFDVFERVADGRLQTIDTAILSVNLSSDSSWLSLLCQFIHCLMISRKYDEAVKYLRTLPIRSHSENKKAVAELAELVYGLLKDIGCEKAAELAEALDSRGRNELLTLAFCDIYSAEKRAFAKELLISLSSSDKRISGKLKLYELFFGGCGQELCEKALKEYVQAYGAENDPDLPMLIFSEKISIGVLAKASDFDIKQSVFICCRRIEGFFEAVENYPVKAAGGEELDILLSVIEKCIGMKLLKYNNASDTEKQQCIKKLFEQKSILKERKSHSALTEFEQLSRSIKANIRSYIAAGEREKAEKTLCEYEKINSRDPEINDLRMLMK